MCDVVIATPDANIGMGGPAMIEGGGLGSFRPEEIGPIDVQRRNGVVHVVAGDVGARLRVPIGTIILRKGYGLGAQAMAAGSFRAPQFVVAWPTGEIGAMGLEGAVRLGFRKELEAPPDTDARDRPFNDSVQLAYQGGRALTAATAFEIDDVIDPADTRRLILTLRGRA
jgi:acetyl-CoA carboxylase carboxyltransferase component